MAGPKKNLIPRDRPGLSGRPRAIAKSLADLYPYQRAWVEDESRFKIACKARQIGFTFAATLRAVLKRLDEPGLTVWLSASERQALEALAQVRRHLAALGVDAEVHADFIAGTLAQQHRATLPNGSRIIALPANPDTVRGFSGDVVLDEFAFHRDSHAIWRAAFATATRGFQLEVISTPNGAQGKYYELARQAGLVEFPQAGAWGLEREIPSMHGLSSSEPGSGDEGACPERSRGAAFVAGLSRNRPTRNAAPLRRDQTHSSPLPTRATSHDSRSVWSAHWSDVFTARALGFAVNIPSLRAAVDDEDTWQQEYCCQFLSDAAHYLPLELVVAAEFSPSPTLRGEALTLSESEGQAPSTATPSPLTSCYLGVDIGRRHDKTVLWLLAEDGRNAGPHSGGILWTRSVETLERAPFATQRAAIESLLALRASDAFRDVLPRQGTALAVPYGTASQNLGAFRSEAERSGDPALFLREAPEVVPPSRALRSGDFLVSRCAIDSTGLGAMLAEELQSRFGARVEPVHFTLAVKEDLAVRLKRRLEERRLRIPYDPAIRRALGAVKRYTTPTGHFRFDAARTDEGHADEFWALALACYAADGRVLSTEFVSTHTPRAFSHAYVF